MSESPTGTKRPGHIIVVAVLFCILAFGLELFLPIFFVHGAAWGYAIPYAIIAGLPIVAAYGLILRKKWSLNLVGVVFLTLILVLLFFLTSLIDEQGLYSYLGVVIDLALISYCGWALHQAYKIGYFDPIK